MKKVIEVLLLGVLTVCLTACGSQNTADTASQKIDTQKADTQKQNSETAQAEEKEASTVESKHKIGVMVYNITDEEVMSFRSYLEDYITSCFENVEFEYSDSISTEEEALEFIESVCKDGAEGIMSFTPLNLQKEVELCEQYKSYYLIASGTVSEENFKKVEDNPYFLGEIGPGSEIEYQAGAEMAQYFIDKKEGDEYFILSGGAPLGNEMHRLRTVAILDTLQKQYGVTFDKNAEELAVSEEPVCIECGELKVCVCPGYIAHDEFLKTAQETYRSNPYSIVLSVLPMGTMSDELRGAQVGVIDCYSSQNMVLFSDGVLNYVAGKYGSLIGPSFAVMYNAVTGYAENFREDGKAFHVTQGFWIAGNLKEYQERYSLATSVVTNAYNYEDLYAVCTEYQKDADLEKLKELASAYSFEEAESRRK